MSIIQKASGPGDGIRAARPSRTAFFGVTEN